VRRHPYSVILLDEVEKAHPEVMNVLLQLLDDGRLTDGKGRVVDFRNTLVVMTSNLCQDSSYELPAVDRHDTERVREHEGRLLTGLAGHFRPEFLNRLDGIVRFDGLSRELIERIVRLELQKVARSLDEQDLQLEATDAAVARLADLGYDPAFGARPVKRVIQREVQDRLADLILSGEVPADSTIVLDNNETGFSLEAAPSRELEAVD